MGNAQKIIEETAEIETIQFNYEAHIKYFNGIFKKLKRIEATSVHQMTSYYFVVNSLLILNDLNDEVKDYVTQFVITNAVIQDKKIIGFRGGPFCGFTKNKKAQLEDEEEAKHIYDICEDVNNFNLIDAENSTREHNKADMPHIASTYSALSILCLFNYLNPESLNILLNKYFPNESIQFSPEEIINHIKKCRRKTGNINCQNWDCENDVRFFYCACAIQKYMEIYNSKDKKMINYNVIDDKNFFLNDELTKTYFNSIRGFEGGFSMEISGESQAGITYCAVASHKLLRLYLEDKDKLLFWLINRVIDGGVNGRTGKVPDSCYSFWSFATLSIIETGDLANKNLIRNFLLNCQCDIGGFSKFLNSDRTQKPDLLHSFYSLACLSLLKVEKLSKFDPVLAVAYE